MTAERIDLSTLLRRRAGEHPDRPLLRCLESGVDLTYGEFDARVDAIARGLAELGVGRRDFVNVMLHNCAEHLLVAYAIKRLGAVYVAINAEFRGPALARMLEVSGAAVLVTSPQLAGQVEDVAGELAALERVILVTGEANVVPVAGRPTDALSRIERTQGPPPEVAIDDSDLATVIFTSGTTGVSKGCLLSHRMVLRSAEVIRDACALTEDDCVFTPYPLFHMRAAHLDALPALLAGARVVLAPRFSASAFWSQMHEHGVTVFSVLGTVMPILWQRPSEPLERGHRVRLAWGGPISVDRDAFHERFGIRVLPGEGVYGMSEVGMLNMSSFDADASGFVRPIYEVRIADDRDDPVAPGTLGEILVRPNEPGVVFDGYLGMPQATLDAWRNLWFHTGDLGRLDEDGRLVFVGRKKDMIRRAGHNISTWEVEEVVHTLDEVVECAAVGVPSAMGEEDVVLFVVTRTPDGLGADDVLEHCRPRMAAFMVPQRVVFVDEIPKTANGKPAKRRLIGVATG